MASRSTMRLDHTSVLSAILRAHGLFGTTDHAFVGRAFRRRFPHELNDARMSTGVAGTVVRLSSIFQETDGRPNFVERDEFLKRDWFAPHEVRLSIIYFVTT